MRRYARLLKFCFQYLRDLLFPTYCNTTAHLSPLFTKKIFSQPLTLPAWHKNVAQAYQHHFFDVLGSGWRRWGIGSCKNRVNFSNRSYAKRIRKTIAPDYQPIDWHLDIREGYRWRASMWSRFIVPAKPKGVDIKIPWELARMHHLPFIALQDLAEPLSSSSPNARNAGEFQNQILDFISTNPPRFGVNWRTPMDAAIRVANWILTYNLYTASGFQFPPQFDHHFSSSIRDHGRFIVEFMEWDPVWRANHYLANVCGLAFIAAFLQADRETDSWLAFAVQELITETQRQIQKDGSVFEASTGYHRLSTEMVVYTTAVILGIIARGGLSRFEQYQTLSVNFPKQLGPPPILLYPLPGNPDLMTPFPELHFRRLECAAEFTTTITKPNGCVALIGDNDSGRFFRLDPTIHFVSKKAALKQYKNLTGESDFSGNTYPIENQLDFQHLINALSAIVCDPTSISSQISESIDYRIAQALADGLFARLPGEKVHNAKSVKPLAKYPDDAKILEVPILEPEVLEDLQMRAFPHFGLYVFRSSRFYLSIRCGAIGQDGFGGHAHNDQLAIELNIDGKDVIKDPGVYRYTVCSEERRSYRSVQAHFAPRVGELEPGNLDLGPWRLGDEARAKVEHFSERCFEGSHVGFGKRVHRQVVIHQDRIIIADWGEEGLEVKDPALLFDSLDEQGCLLAFCPGYGIRLS
jgi:hypothetical protein